MLNKYDDLVVEIYTSQIKSTLIIDDQYPTYDNIGEDISTFTQSAEAKELFNFCRTNGWTCDIENSVDKAMDNGMPNHLYQSDLIILDYHLTIGDDEDGSKAIDFIKHLTATPHFNIVVLYTSANDLKTVAFEIFSNLKKTQFEDKDFSSVIELIELICDDFPDFFEGLKDCIELVDIANFMQYNKIKSSKYPKINEFITETIRLVNIPLKSPLSSKRDDLIEYILLKQYQSLSPAQGTLQNVRTNINTEFMWIETGNLFLAITSKTESPSHILDNLKKTLVKWRPDPVKLILMGFQNSIEQNGLEYSHHLFPTKKTSAAWMYQCLKSCDRESAITDLSKKLFYHLGQKVIKNSTDTHRQLFESMNDLSPEIIINDFYDEQVNTNEKLIELYKYINAYQCSHDVITKHLTTGLVLKNEMDEFWLVLNCSCDLMPSQTYGWSHKMTPWLPFTAVKLSIDPNESKALRNVTRGNDIYLRNEDDVKIYRFAENSPTPHYETFYADGHGELVDNNQLTVKSVHPGKTRTPIFKKGKMTAVSQLRYEFACRFLNKLANHKSRIGVDFIALPNESTAV